MKKYHYISKCILLILLSLSLLTGCASKDPLDLAKRYIEEGDFKSALETLTDIDEDKTSEESYGLILDIHKEENNFGKLKEVVDEYLNKGFKLKNKSILLDLFNHFDSIGDNNTVKNMLSNDKYDVRLPEELYIKNIVEPNIPEDMEVLETLVEDITYDGKKEIIVRLGKIDKEREHPEGYIRLELMVFKSDGSVLYHDEGFDSHTEGVSYIELVDFTGDGKNELYYGQQHYTNFIHEVVSIVDFKGSSIKELYGDTDKIYDFKPVRLEENTAKIFSQEARKSFLLERDETVFFYDIDDMRINFGGSELRDRGQGNKVELVEGYSVWDAGGAYGQALFVYEYENGQMVFKDFEFETSEGVRILKVIEGQDYDFVEEAKNHLIGFWDYDNDGDSYEKYRMKITDDYLVDYVVNSDVLSEEEYEIVNYDKENQIIDIKTQDGISKYKLTDYNKLEITFVNGHKSRWTYLYNIYQQ